MKKLPPLLMIAMLYPWLTGFVLLSSHKARLDISAASPTVHFIWDGNAPAIKEKDKFRGGAYEDLDDQAFMQQLLTEAMALWNDVPDAYVDMQVAQDSNAVLDEEDALFSIVVEKSDNLSTAAFAKPKIEDDAPTVIRDCDISIADTSSPAKDLAFTIAHELGHCLGLGHAHTNYNAIMGYSRTARDMKLGADDMAGVIYLYPDPSHVPDEPKEIVCGSVGAASGGGPGTPFLLLLLAMPLLLAAASTKASKHLARPVHDAGRGLT